MAEKNDGAAKGFLRHVAGDPTVTDEESLQDALDEPARKGAHTPGPWGAFIKGSTIAIFRARKDGEPRRRRRSGRMIEVISWTGFEGSDDSIGVPEQAANARLIAEAPAMEEDVLRKLVEAFNRDEDLADRAAVVATAAWAARAILARIDGE